MGAIEPPAGPFTIQALGGPLVASLTFTLDHDVSLVSQITGGEPVPDGLRQTMRRAYADVLVLDHGTFAEAWRSEADSAGLLRAHDDLVAAVLEAYAPERVVLLRTAIRRFVWTGNRVEPRRHHGESRDVETLRRFVRRLDARFAEATGCRVVAAACRHLPVRDMLAHDPAPSGDAVLDLERAVLAACRSGEGAGTTAGTTGESGFAAAVQAALLAGPADPADLLGLLPDEGLQAHDDVAALAAALAAAPEADWSQVARAALPSGGVVHDEMATRVASNRAALREYPYVHASGGTDLPGPRRLVSRIAGAWFLVVQPEHGRPLVMRNYGRRGRFDPVAFCDRGYVCAPSQIDAALESWEAYFERGRRGDSAPFRLDFDNERAFRESLEFLDYADILANESYCVTVGGAMPVEVGWRAKVDLSFLFDPHTRVCILRNGFGDQLFHYVHTRELVERHGLRLFLDDLQFDSPKPRLQNPHSRPDLVALARAEGTFSEIFSRRLRHRRRMRRQPILDRSEYAALGLAEQVVVVDRLKMEALLRRDIDPTALPVVALTLDHLARAIASPPPGVVFIDVLAKGRFLRLPRMDDKGIWERALTWNGFVTEAAVEVAEEMLATDAVVVHVRRGDRAARGTADPDDYYRAFVQRAATLEEFGDKHLFVFSDDIDYCRTHRHELGLDLLGEAVTFVEGNRHFASIDDFHLMSLGRVVICGQSGFSATAAMTSTRVEYVFGDGYGEDGSDLWHRPAGGRTA